jgi:CHRD domain
MRTHWMVAAALLGAAASGAVADGKDRIRARLTGYQEVPAVSTPASGRFVADVARDGESFDYELTYRGLQGVITQAHIHFAQKSVNGPIVIWLCRTATNPGPAAPIQAPECHVNTAGQAGEFSVSGRITAAHVLASPATQQLPAGALGEALAAMRAGAAYVNVHTTVSPGGEIRGQTRGRGMRKEDERDVHDGDHKH